ncbi:F-box-like domain superfamily [Arabidopsis suecica]|uniref:F-box-like domain superfamily n=1 Tax=Arabidopsis suecica TaxID=45249 RepID=A0A8T2BQZ2_ARASU|nr:F-box-like domain superfamily [Arabidopsis suecica]
MNDDEEPPLKKNKLPIEPTLNLSLPEDLIVSILARVSRLSYRNLSLVCKRFHWLLTSGELHRIRSLSGCTENCLYVCLRFSHNDHIPRWFMLRRRPNETLTNDTRKKKKKNKSSGYVLETIPFPHPPPAHGWGLVAVGSNIYNIGGSIYGCRSNSVSILDCWSNTWLKAPSMQVDRCRPSANFLDGKIYVTGGHASYKNASHYMEVFDLKTKTWEPVLSSSGRMTLYKTKNVVVDGKLYVVGNKGVVYNPKDDTWDSLGPEMNLGSKWFSSCVIENVLYYYYYEEGIKWYDTKARSWRSLLNGMRKLPKFARHANVRLADYGGKMALFWDKFVASGGGLGYQNRMIWCAMIALERSDSGNIWGKVEWFDAVLPNPIPKEYVFEYVGAVNV